MDAQAAARSGDEIAHGVGMAAMIGGALLGALAGAALVVATAATGGVAAVIVAGAVAGGGLSVGSLVKGLATICSLPEPSSGVLMAGSLNVWVNSRPAQRASLDRAAVCSGFPMNHYSLPMPLVAEGSASVFINGCPAARLSSKLICGAHIKSASPNVTWGGPTVRTDAVFDREEWLRTGLQGLGVLALVGGCLVGSFVGAVITAGAFVIGHVVFGALRQWGDSLGPGYADLFEGVAGIALFAGGARAAAKAKMPAVAEGEGTVVSTNKYPDEISARVASAAKDIIDSGKSEGPAISRIGSSELGIESGNFLNYSKAELGVGKVTEFPGVKFIGQGKFIVENTDAYMARMKMVYEENDGYMHSTTEKNIFDSISNNKELDIRAGLPGAHSEVRAQNWLLIKTSGNLPSDVSMATYRLSTTNAGSPFPACSNCSRIVLPDVEVSTGRRN